jgi:hypothetical protein
MTTESGEKFQTLFDEKRLYRLLNAKKQKNGVYIFKAELIDKKERGMSDEELERSTNEYLRDYNKKRLEGDLQMNNYILLGWYQGHPKAACYMNWKQDAKYGWISERGMAAYLPVAGALWVYIWPTHARYAPHPDPRWGKEGRWTHFPETDKKPKRISPKKMSDLFSQTKPESYKENSPKNAWMLSVPVWLLDEKKDMRPLYLAGEKPENGGKS